MNYEKTSEAESKEAVRLMALAENYASPRIIVDDFTMRESSYALEAVLDDMAINNTPNGALADEMMEVMLGQLDQVFMAKNYDWYQPFMVGLISEALIQYHTERKQDPRIVYYLKKSLDEMWNQAWDGSRNGFYYRCYQDGCYTPSDGSLYPPTGSKNIEVFPDLNTLIAPAYSWMFLQTGDPIYRQRGDTIFSNGVRYKDFYYGKQFSQAYRWSTDFVKWREAANTLGANAAPVADTEAPKVIVNAPAANTTISGPVTLKAVPEDNINVVGVQFRIDGQNVGSSVISPPFETKFESTLLTNGSHSVTAIAYDSAGNTGVSPAVNINVNNPVNSAMNACSPSSLPTNKYKTCYYTHGFTPNYLDDMYYNLNNDGSVRPARNLGNLTVTKEDSTINFNWGHGAPTEGIPESFFGVVWQGIFSFEAGKYNFNWSRTGGGMRVYINNKMVSNGWWPPMSPSGNTNEVFLTTGNHLIRVEYWRGYSDTTSNISLNWIKDNSYILPFVGNNPAPSNENPLPTPSYKPGDFNLDGFVNSQDVSLMTAAWNTNNPKFDLNKDLVVNTIDFAILSSNWSR